MLGPSVVIAAVGEIVFQIVHDEDALRLRVGYQIIASATVADRALLNLRHVGRSHARRHDLSM